MKHAALAVLALTLAVGSPSADACTNFLISRGASADGSTMITYSADSHQLYGELYLTPGGSHLPTAERDVHEWDTGKYLGKIPQATVTYTVVGNINEWQVSIGETTYGGRKELEEPNGIIDYGSLMYIALERARTAREAIRIMGELVAEHGYASSGESFSVADPYEVWHMELIGKGKDEKGAVWVARRVPEGYVSAHANQARIRTFPLKDKKNCLYSEDVISFARKQGWFDGADADFSFADAYAPLDFGALRFCELRVFAFFNRIAPSLKLPTDYIDAKPGAEPLPLFVKPDRKLSLQDTMELMRDHFEGTKWDLGKGVGAGPYELPYRWRPMVWEARGKKYVHERSTSTQQTGFSFVAQARSWLPNPLGGVLWFGVDDTATTVYVPMYCGIREAPSPFAVGTGDFDSFSWDSAFWVFNFVTNYTYSRWKDMFQEVQKVQRELEGGFVGRQQGVDAAALELYRRSPELARDYLTETSARAAGAAVERYRKLGEFLIWKYLDGNVRDEHGKITQPGYPAHWLERIADEGGEHLEKKRLPGEPEEESH
ncbi:MAG TPA: C69 family dipeptidase [Polyangia bacterium]|nr:C69 family dipeptidase [Polyangia bacterium]